MGSYCTNKYWKLIWKVIFDEIFLKRSSQLKSICEGLELSRLLSYIRKVSAKYQQIFSKVSYILQKDFCCKFRPTNSAEFTRHTKMENEETFEKKQPHFFFFSIWKRQTPISCWIFRNCHWLYQDSAVENGKRHYFKLLGIWWRENAPRVNGVFQYFISTNCSLKPDI